MKFDKKFLIPITILAIAAVLVYVCLFHESPKGEYVRDLAQIEADGELRIVTDYDPVGYYVVGDTIEGFNYDLIYLLQKYTTQKIVISLEASLEKSIEGLKSGKYDIMLRNIPITTELRDSLSFTIPVSHNKQVLIQRNKESNNGIEPIRNHLELANKTIYVPKNSPAILRINNLSHEIGDTIHYIEDEFYGSEQLAMKVASSEIDYAICDENAAQRLAVSLPEIDYKTSVGFTHLEAWAIRKNAPILEDSLNRWIARMKETTEYKKIYKKYHK